MEAGKDITAVRTMGSDRRVNALFGGVAVAALLFLGSVGAVSAADKGPKDPQMSPEANPVEFDKDAFGSDPSYEDKPYDPEAQYIIYGNKQPSENPRPLLELGRPIYTEGPFKPGINLIGRRNLVFPTLSIFGDVRTAVEYNDNGAVEIGQIAVDANLDIDLKLTGTERIHAFVEPFDRDGNATRYEFFGDDEDGGEEQINGNIETLFFEGDVGQIASGLMDRDAGFDLPIAFGLTPLLFQNGIWMEEAIWGGAFTIAAKNSPALDISNMDFTFFGGFDHVENPGIRNAQGLREQHNLNVFGAAAFIETMEGYFEFGVGRIEGEDQLDDQSFNSLTGAFSKRYGGWLSNSVRAIWTFGQDRDNNQIQTADGLAILIENSLVTHKPSTLVPYFNFFLGLDRPQPLADETGLLKNTGITFEDPGITNFPKLNDLANDAFGGAIGVQYLFNLDQQIVVEAATSQRIGGFDANRAVPNDEYALGFRYQLPIAAAWIVRADGILGFRQDAEDIRGIRLELRRKF